jgi:hypothetical protein
MKMEQNTCETHEKRVALTFGNVPKILCGKIHCSCSNIPSNELNRGNGEELNFQNDNKASIEKG